MPLDIITYNKLQKAIKDGNNLAGWTEESEQLNGKITEVDTRLTSELAEKAKKSDVFLKADGININDFDEPTRQTFLEAQGIDVNYVLGEKNVFPQNTTFFKPINLFNPNSATIGAFVNYDGTIATNPDYYYSDYIPVKPNTTYIVPFNIKVMGVEYTTDKTFIKYLNRQNWVQPYTDLSVFTTSATTQFVRVNGYKGTGTYTVTPLQEYMLIEGNSYPSEYIYFNDFESYISDKSMNRETIKSIVNESIVDNEPQTQNVLSGKILACAGDSITEGVNADIDPETGLRKTYGYLIAKRNNMTFLNYGVGGSTLARNGASKAFTYQRYSQMADNIDYLTIWFGWNDFAYVELGTPESTDDTTFYGAWNFVLPYLIDKYPTTKIGLVVPYGTNPDWRNAVRNMGKKWGLPYLDLMSAETPLFFDKEPEIGLDPSIVTKRKATFLADAVHPNQVGYDYLSPIIEDFVRRL